MKAESKPAINSRIIIASVLSISLILCGLSIHEGHNWGGDFSMYIQQARAITDGSMQELYVANKQLEANSLRRLGPDLYPNGFPLLLAPVYYFFGLDFVAMKWFCALFLLLSIPVIYKLFRDELQGKVGIFVAFFIALHYQIVVFSDNVLSDLPFFFFSLIAILLMRSKAGLINLALLGFAIFYAWFTREIAICLIPALLVYQAFHQENKPQKRWYLLVPYITIVCLFVLRKLLFPLGSGQNYYQMFDGFSFQTAFGNLLFYLKLCVGFFVPVHLTNQIVVFVAPVIIGLVILGMGTAWRKHLYLIVYVVANLLILSIWPYRQGLRYLFPILPFLVFFFFSGISYVLGKLPEKKLKIYVIPAYVAVFAAFGIFHVSRFSIYYNRNEAYNEEMKQVYSYIKENVPENKIIAFRKPRVLRLFTGRNGIFTDLAHFSDAPADYLLISEGDVQTLYTAKLVEVKKIGGYVLYRK